METQTSRWTRNCHQGTCVLSLMLSDKKITVPPTHSSTFNPSHIYPFFFPFIWNVLLDCFS
jgi:hypothetical protein